jgi:hypothetical protein
VLEGTNDANRRHGASCHPRVARYAYHLEDLSDAWPMLHRAAFAIVERLALCGEAGYCGLR